MAAFRDLLPYISSSTKSIGDDELVHWLKNSTYETVAALGVLKKSVCVQIEETDETTATSYLLQPPDGYKFVRILRIYDEDENRFHTDFFRNITLVGNDGIWHPPKSIEQYESVNVEYCWTVQRNATTLPDEIFNEIPHVIALGAMAKIDRTYHTDPQRNWEMEYQEAVTAAHFRFSGGIVRMDVGSVWQRRERNGSNFTV